MISGATQDFKLFLDFLPSYLPQFTKFRNIMLGVSLGGHTAWRMASLAPNQLEAFAIVVGCPSLGSLLLERLGVDAASAGIKPEQLHTLSYDELEPILTDEQRRRWPRALADLVREADRKVDEEFPSRIPMLLCNGEFDKLVPARHTSTWLERRKLLLNGSFSEQKGGTKLFVQGNTGHSCTKEMVAMMADWLGNMYES